MTWFQESFVLRRALTEPPIIGHADAIWDSGAIPHDTRWSLRLPSREETLHYIAEVTDRVAARLNRPEATAQLRYITRYAVHHHDMHTEALTYTRQTLGYPPPVLPGIDVVLSSEAGGLPGDAEVPGGRFPLGGDRGEGFVYDNEKWVHPVELVPFAIARAPVTQSEYARFVDDGGYARRELWTDEGWAWRSCSAADMPVYWQRGTGGWQRRDFDRWVPLEPHRPVSHVCWYEADAYCRWAGRRLPTEAEWEAAAIGEPDGSGGLSSMRRRFPWDNEPIGPGHANLDWKHLSTVDVAAYPAGDSALLPSADRLLPAGSRVRIRHAGTVIDRELGERAARENRDNPGYRWVGELPRSEALRLLAGSRLLLLTSRHEGGANTISEALAAGVPVLSTRVPGTVGILGADYPGYFPVGDPARLAQLLVHAETDEDWYQELHHQCTALRTLVAPKHERESWQQLLAELAPPRSTGKPTGPGCL